MKEARIEKTPEGQVPARRRSVAARQWDYLHSPPGTEHITVGAGESRARS